MEQLYSLLLIFTTYYLCTFIIRTSIVSQSILINDNHRGHSFMHRKESLIRIDLVDIDDIEFEGKPIMGNHENHFGNIYLNLFLFYDEPLIRRFHHDKQKLYRFIYAVTNSASLSYNNLPMKQLAQFHFVILDIQQIHDSIKIDDKADGEQYRQSFRQFYQLNETMQQQRYAATILLTGYNFRFRRNKTDTQGLATVGHIACNRPMESFILVEARSYRTAFIMAHELGHVLSMYHDEEIPETSCSTNYIMSSTTGPGKTQFSICSYLQLKQYFLVMNEKTKKCFHYSPPATNVKMIQFPCNDHHHCPNNDLSITVDEQCKMALGETFRANILNIELVSICTKIQCTNNLVNIYIDPAIENTTCGPNKYCRGGKCI
mgnify:FL=1